MLPIPGYHRLVQQLPLDLGVLAPQHRNDAIAVELRIQRIARQVRDGHRHIAAVDGDDVGEHPPTERALVHEAQRGAVEQRSDAQMVLAGQRPEQHLSAHSQMHDKGRAVVERQPQVLPAPTRADDARIE